MKGLLIALTTGVLALGALLIQELSANPKPAAILPVAPLPAATVTRAEPARAALPPPIEMRAEIQRTTQIEVAPLKNSGDMERYLGDLEARARRNRQVTALEVEPGMMAIQQLGGEQALTRSREFSKRMAQLSAEYQVRSE